jgi:hypothetical protein
MARHPALRFERCADNLGLACRDMRGSRKMAGPAACAFDAPYQNFNMPRLTPGRIPEIGTINEHRQRGSAGLAHAMRAGNIPCPDPIGDLCKTIADCAVVVRPRARQKRIKNARRLAKGQPCAKFALNMLQLRCRSARKQPCGTLACGTDG